MQTKILIACDNVTVIKDIEDGTGGNHASVVREMIARRNEFQSCLLVHMNLVEGSMKLIVSLTKFSLSLSLG